MDYVMIIEIAHGVQNRHERGLLICYYYKINLARPSRI